MPPSEGGRLVYDGRRLRASEQLNFQVLWGWFRRLAAIRLVAYRRRSTKLRLESSFSDCRCAYRSVSQILDPAVQIGSLAYDARQISGHGGVEERASPGGRQILQEVRPKFSGAPRS